MSSRKVCHACVSMSRDFLCGVCDAPSEDVRAVVDEPVAWMSECIRGYKKGVIEQTDGPGSTHNIEYWTPDFPVYRHPQRSVDTVAIREIRDRFVQAADLARKAAAICKELNERGAEKTYLKSAAAHDARVATLDAVLGG